MSVAFFILGVLVVPDLLWWRWADRVARPSRAGRIAIAVYSAFMLGQILWILVDPSTARRSHLWLPIPLIAATYLWHLLVLPITGILVLGAKAVRFRPSRRAFLLGVPPVATGVLSAFSLRQFGDLRLRSVDVALRGLRRELEGTTIAHVSDLHAGKFTRQEGIDRMVEMVNGLRADLVLFTGDLIDLSLVDLGRGAEALRRLDARSGMHMCLGNHDLIESREGFLAAVAREGLPLLLDEAAEVKVRGVPVQLLGIGWGDPEARMEKMRALRDPDAFPILLAHHPHVFDHSGDLPLVLSGHTHGGQLMLNEALGAGPVLFRYWSGPYHRGGSTLVVSNGVGNWFPLRTHAPAEVVSVTLHAVD